MRLIDADALMKKATNAKKYDPEMMVVGLGYVYSAPTIDPVKHGQWICNTDDFTPKKRCSCCGYNKPIAAGENINPEPENYCSNCGCRMNVDE